MLRFLTHHWREYVSSGDTEAPLNWMVPPIRTMLGEVPPEVDDACRVLAKLGPSLPEHQEEIARCLALLEKQDLSNASDLTVASVLAMRTKFDFFMKVFPSDPSDEGPIREYLTTYELLIPKCWEAFRKIFQVISVENCQDPELFPRYLSRFAHFCQGYNVNAEKTPRNQKHSEDLAAVLFAALLKHVISVPPAQQGHNYTASKIAREIILSMHLKYDTNEHLRDLALLVLSVSYDYLNCVSFQETKRHIVNDVFRGRRLLLDDLIETRMLAHLTNTHPNSTVSQGVQKWGRYLCDRWHSNLLEDLASCALVNTFGSEEERSYEELDALHLKIFVSNEVTHGHVMVLIFRRQFVVKYLPGMPKEFAETVKSALHASVEIDVDSLLMWQKLGDQLTLGQIKNDFQDLTKGERVNRVYIYPDGYLWNVPWSYVLRWFWKDLRKPIDPEIPKVAVKLGARRVPTKATAKIGVFAAGWDYKNIGLEGALLRRGQREKGLLPDLPGARGEVDALANFWQQKGAACTCDQNLTAEGLLKHVENFSSPAVLHIACHGEAFPGGIPTLWLPSELPKQSYTAVHYERILRVDWRKCEFAFFNSCFGASGTPFVGGPSLGLQESLSIAGVRLLVAPLWPVSDAYAKEIAVSFHHELAESGDYLDAFTAARARVSVSERNRKALTYAAYNFVIL